MTALDLIRIEKNPDQKFIDVILMEIIRTEDWNKTRECEIWKEGLEVYEFYVAFDGDKPVGCISLTMDNSANGDPSDNLFYIGNFYTREEYRGIGLGVKMFNLVMERTKGTNLFLDSVVKVSDFYDRKFGFSLIPDYLNVLVKLDPAHIHPKTDIDCMGYKIVDVSEANWDSVASFDRKICLRERSRYLKAWTCYKDANTKVALDKDGSVIGLICARPQIKNRLSIGPFYAENKEVAEILLHKMISRPDLKSFELVVFRFPEANPDAEALLVSITDEDFVRRRGSRNQFNKKLIIPDNKKVFGIFEPNHCIV